MATDMFSHGDKIKDPSSAPAYRFAFSGVGRWFLNDMPREGVEGGVSVGYRTQSLGRPLDKTSLAIGLSGQSWQRCFRIRIRGGRGRVEVIRRVSLNATRAVLVSGVPLASVALDSLGSCQLS